MLTKWVSKKEGGNMKTIATAIPGYRVFEYLLVLNPHEELRNRIVEVKKGFNEKYRIETPATSPQVALVKFVQYGLMEERIIQRLKVVAMGCQPFKVELKDFGSFPSHSIYINMVSKLPVQNLVKQIRHESQRLMKFNDDNKPHFMLEPHINIASKLLPWQYEKGWLEYSNKNFSGRFIADTISLLKRPQGEIKYHLLQRFELMNMPVNTLQGQLFL